MAVPPSMAGLSRRTGKKEARHAGRPPLVVRGWVCVKVLKKRRHGSLDDFSCLSLFLCGQLSHDPVFFCVWRRGLRCRAEPLVLPP